MLGHVDNVIKLSWPFTCVSNYQFMKQSPDYKYFLSLHGIALKYLNTFSQLLKKLHFSSGITFSSTNLPSNIKETVRNHKQKIRKIVVNSKHYWEMCALWSTKGKYRGIIIPTAQRKAPSEAQMFSAHNQLQPRIPSLLPSRPPITEFPSQPKTHYSLSLPPQHSFLYLFPLESTLQIVGLELGP